MMQNAVNESFWDAHGVEIGPCANFDPKTFFGGVAKKMMGLILWEAKTKAQGRSGAPIGPNEAPSVPGSMGPWGTSALFY